MNLTTKDIYRPAVRKFMQDVALVVVERELEDEIAVIYKAVGKILDGRPRAAALAALAILLEGGINAALEAEQE